MIAIRSSDGEPPEIDLSATRSEFMRLATSISDVEESVLSEMVIPADEAADPRPWDRTLAELRIRFRPGRLVLSISGERSLVVSGGRLELEKFVSNFPVEPELQPGYHVHFEPIGRDFVSPESVSLVLRVAEESDAS
jgi:hypothetical protein